MKAVWILLAASISVAFAGPLTSTAIANIIAQQVPSLRNSLIEQALLDAIESIRDVILHGADGIPPLDPLYIEDLKLDDDIIPFPGSQLDLKGVTVNNLATFEIDNLKANMYSPVPVRYRIIIDGKIPLLELAAEHYDVNLSAMGISIFGAGNAKINVTNPRLKVDVLVRARLIGGIYITLEDTKVQFDLDTFEPKITGLFHHEGASDFVNVFLQDLVPNLVKHYESEITDFLSETVQTVANDILKDLDLSEFLPF